jgi:hypothetical protein
MTPPAPAGQKSINFISHVSGQDWHKARATGRYAGCYVRTTVSGDNSDHTLASDAHLHTCDACKRQPGRHPRLAIVRHAQ